MKRKHAIAAVIAFAGLTHLCIARAAQGQEKRPPNIVLIVADDKY